MVLLWYKALAQGTRTKRERENPNDVPCRPLNMRFWALSCPKPLNHEPYKLDLGFSISVQGLGFRVNPRPKPDHRNGLLAGGHPAVLLRATHRTRLVLDRRRECGCKGPENMGVGLRIRGFLVQGVGYVLLKPFTKRRHHESIDLVWRALGDLKPCYNFSADSTTII